MPKITPFLWFDHQAADAAAFYCAVFPNCTLISQSAQIVTLELEGQRLCLLNGGPHYRLSPAFSLFVSCDTQAEIDDLWRKLTADGGEASRCGWLTDKYGLSWQLVPPMLGPYLQDPDPIKAKRVLDAMLTMTKLEIAELQRAYDGD